MTAILPKLFDAPVRTAEVDPYGEGISALWEEEARGLATEHEGRRLEFRAGRHCARLAMRAIGVEAPVPRARDRSPVWPPGIVGSITHTRSRRAGFCGAVVGEGPRIRSLGVDAELDEPLGEHLWERVLTAREHSALAALSPDERGLLAKVVFSAKESVYKCQHPLTAQFLEFGEVEVELAPRDGTFRARLLRDAGPLRSGHAFQGRFAREAGYIVTGVTMT